MADIAVIQNLSERYETTQTYINTESSKHNKHACCFHIQVRLIMAATLWGSPDSHGLTERTNRLRPTRPASLTSPTHEMIYDGGGCDRIITGQSYFQFYPLVTLLFYQRMAERGAPNRCTESPPRICFQLHYFFVSPLLSPKTFTSSPVRYYSFHYILHLHIHFSIYISSDLSICLLIRLYQSIYYLSMYAFTHRQTVVLLFFIYWMQFQHS